MKKDYFEIICSGFTISIFVMNVWYVPSFKESVSGF